jgi:prefoldin beta subunit
MKELSEEAKNLLSQFQSYQQQLQALLVQKENLRLQSLEIDRALEELKATSQRTAYKITGNVMVQKPVAKLKKELNEQKENVMVRLKSIERAEQRTTERLKELQKKLEEVMGR